MGFGTCGRIVRRALNPLQAVGQETSSHFVERPQGALLIDWPRYETGAGANRPRRHRTFAGRLGLSDERFAPRKRVIGDTVRATAPVRIVLIGQSMRKSSLVIALAQKRCRRRAPCGNFACGDTARTEGNRP